MTRTTGIEWTEHTWNPVLGCSLASAGCTNCYAMRTAHRLAAMGQSQYTGLTRMTRGGAVWTGQMRRATDAQMRKPRRIRGRAIIFVNSMSDLFHPDADDAWRDEAYAVMAATPQHTYQVLTKRPDYAAQWYARRPQWQHLPHVWMGASVERADVTHRLDPLRAVPAAIRFLSIEPLIGSVGDLNLAAGGIHWIITGGESGAGARLCDPTWVREVRDQCAAAAVPFFHKQWGTYRSNPLVAEAHRSIAEAAAADHNGKGGALLDGRLWREMPTPQPAQPDLL